MTDLEKLYATIQGGFDLLDRRSVLIEKMADAYRKLATACEEFARLQDEAQ